MFTGMVGYGINTVVGFVCRIIFVRTLAADYLGVNGLFTNILSVLSLAELGISSAIIYALYKPIADNDEKKITAVMQFYRKAYTAIGCFVAVVGLSIMPFLNLIITDPPNIKESIYLLYILYLGTTVTSYFFSYCQSLLIAAQRQYIVSGYSYVITIGQSVLQIIYLVLTREYIGYLLIQIVGSITYNVWISAKAGKDYPYIKNKDVDPLSKEERRSLFRNIKALAINKVSGVLVNSTDNIVISIFNGISAVGFASNYTLLSSTLNSVITLLFNGLTGSIGNYNSSSDEEKRYNLYKSLKLANFWVYGWAAIGMIFVSSDLVCLLFGNEYRMSPEIPFVLAMNFFTIGLIHATYSFKSTLGLFRHGQYILIFTGIINVFLDVILGKLFGVFGIYLATLIARFCTNLWYEPYAVYKYGLNKPPILYWIDYAHFTFVFVITCGVCLFFCELCHFSYVINTIVKCVICSVIPNGLFLGFFGKTQEFQFIKNALLRMIRKH